MKVVIIGAGSMGSLFGARLASKGEEVWLVDIWEEHIDSINQNGLTLKDRTSGKEEVISTYPRAVLDAKDIGNKEDIDLVIIFVKSYDTEAAVKKAKDIIGKKTQILTLQNGVGNGEILEKYVLPEKIIIGTTEQGGLIESPGVVVHMADRPTNIGFYDTSPDNAPIEEIKESFVNAGLETNIIEDVMSLVWSKLIVNVGFNAPTAITRLRNKDFLKIPESNEVIRMCINEAIQVCEAKGVNLAFDTDDIPGYIIHLGSTIYYHHRLSMCQDVVNKRRTEVEFINGAVVREGKRLNIPTPANVVITNLIKIIENNYEIYRQED